MNGGKFTALSSLSDETLVGMAQSGNDDALEVLARRFLGRRKNTAPVGFLDSDDLIQEGMFGFLSAVRTFSEQKGVSFSAYAAVCMNNRIASAARKTMNELPIDSECDPVSVEGEVKNPLDSIVESENLSSVLAICENVLSDAEKSVVFCQMSGLSYSETAQKLGISPKAVDNALQRARRKLKNVFA